MKVIRRLSLSIGDEVSGWKWDGLVADNALSRSQGLPAAR